MASDYSPTWDFPAKETQTNQEPENQEAKSETRKDVIYKTKEIQFLGRKTHIILQNENGPCPLIAIYNILLLRNDMPLYPDTFEVSQERLLSLVAETLIDSKSDVDSKGEEYIENQQQNISDAIDCLPCLADGINVNIKFRRIDDFEFTPELAIFDLLKIPLYHGWIVDPQDFETAIAIGSKSYNDLITGLVAMETQTVMARSSRISGECAAITAALRVPSQLFSKTRSFAESSAEHRRLKKGDIEEEIVLLRALQLSEREALGFDTHRDSSSGESVSASSNENQISEDDTLVTSVDAAAGCSSTLGSSICQQSKSDDQFSSTESEDDTDCDVGNKIKVGEEVRSVTSTTKCSGGLDHDQLSSTELGDETVCDVETEKSSKMTDVHVTSSEAIYMKKTNLESTNNDNSLEIPLKSDAVTFVNPDRSGKSKDDDLPLYEAEKCVSLSSPVFGGEPIFGESSSKGGDTSGLTLEEGEVIDNFLKDNASQLTFPGLFFLVQGLEEGELCVFFRNNHFSTMLKYENELYLLVTDQGYLTQRDLVWEKLNQVNGDSIFMTGDFKVFVFKSDSRESRKWDQQDAISNTADYIFSINSSSEEGTEIDPDLKMAMELQQRELGGVSDSEVLLDDFNTYIRI